MKTVVCDICHKECIDKTEYIFPIYSMLKSINTHISINGIESQKYNLCESCKTNIAEIIKQLILKKEEN